MGSQSQLSVVQEVGLLVDAHAAQIHLIDVTSAARQSTEDSLKMCGMKGDLVRSPRPLLSKVPT